MALDCSVIRFRDNQILCQGLNELIQGQEATNQLLQNIDVSGLSTISSFLTQDSVYFFLGVICAIAFIQGVKLRL
jgi:hypothetical protein